MPKSSDSWSEADAKSSRRRSGRIPEVYRLLDFATGAGLIILILLSPWLFGSTEEWAVISMSGGGALAGLLFLAKRIYSRVNGFEPSRWVTNEKALWLIRLMGGITVFLLVYCAVSAWNARATFHVGENQFAYHKTISWLPASYDSNRSWLAFWEYLGFAGFFWAAWDWMQLKSRKERRGGSEVEEDDTFKPKKPLLPARTRWLLWTLCLNAALVAVQGLLQRFSNSSELLWLRESYFHSAIICFGPYSYRSNAAQYINLVWPVCLGLWWVCKERGVTESGRPLRAGEGPHLILIPAAIVLAATPIITASRGGALVSFALMAGTLVLFFFRRDSTWKLRLGMIVLFAAICAAGYVLGWTTLDGRLKKIFKERLSDRIEISRNSERMAEDFVWYGSGPGTFGAVYQLYRSDPDQIWQNHLHNDFKETRVTFGVVGYSLIMAMLLLVVCRWFLPGGIEAPFLFSSLVWLALLGCLVHAGLDFPLQVYSILQVFLLLCAVLMNLSRPLPVR
jgi:hypothetical protein